MLHELNNYFQVEEPFQSLGVVEYRACRLCEGDMPNERDNVMCQTRIIAKLVPPNPQDRCRVAASQADLGHIRQFLL